MRDTAEEPCRTDDLRRQLADERRLRFWLMDRVALDLARIDQRLIAIEDRLGSTRPSSGNGTTTWTSSQWLKLLTGILLPLAVLLLTGNVQLARQIMAP